MAELYRGVIRGDTDEKGQFVLAGVASGPNMLTAERVGYSPVNYTEGTATARVSRFTVIAGKTKTIRLRLMPLGVMAGIIRACRSRRALNI